MKIKIKYQQIQRVLQLIREQEEGAGSTLTGPFRCIEYEKLDMGGGYSLMGKREPSYHKWKEEDTYWSGEYCGPEGNKVYVTINRILEFQQKRVGDNILKPFELQIKITIPTCEDEKEEIGDVYIWMTKGYYDCSAAGVILYDFRPGKYMKWDKESKEYENDNGEGMISLFNKPLPTRISDTNLEGLQNILKGIKYKK